MNKLPFEPCDGKEPYIFLSYSRKDTDLIAPWVSRLDNDHYRMWYDRAIRGSAIWAQEIEEHIQAAQYMLLFLSPHAVDSEWVRNEITYARECRLPICPVHLCHTTLKHGLNILLNSFNPLKLEDYSAEDFYEELCRSLPEKAKQLEPVLESVPPKPADWPTDWPWNPSPSTPKPEPALPKPSPETDFEWETSVNYARVTKYKGNDRQVKIPSEYQGKSVYRISTECFKRNDYIEYVVVPRSVESIGRDAFIGCSSLRCITITKITTDIARQAFDASSEYNSFRLVFRCPYGSYAEQYAHEHNFKVEYTD